MHFILSNDQAEEDSGRILTQRDEKTGKKPKLAAKVLLPIALLSLPACSVAKGLGTVDTSPNILTSSVSQEATKKDGIASTDAELIKTVVVDSNNTNTLAWQNPDTGNQGTITAIDNFIGDNGRQCKKFQTTVTSFMGISLYNGETCELKKGFWVLSWFLREEA